MERQVAAECWTCGEVLGTWQPTDEGNGWVAAFAAVAAHEASNKGHDAEAYDHAHMGVD